MQQEISLYVDDAVEAAIRAAIVGENIGPINIVRGGSKPVSEIVGSLMELMTHEGEIVFLRDKPDGYSYFFDNSMMRSILGKWSFTSLEEGLSKEIESIRRIQCER